MLRLSIAFLFCISCGGQVDTQDGGGDAATTNEATTGEDAGAACNTLVLSGQPVAIAQIASDAPTFAGQSSSNPTLELGLYQLTSMTIYTGPNGSSQTGNTITTVARFSAGDGDVIIDSYSVTGMNDVVRQTSTATSATTSSFQLTQVCPTSAPAVTVQDAFDGKTLTLRVLETEAAETIDETFALVAP